MWDLPGPGLEAVSPALAGWFLTTVPPGKSQILFEICSRIEIELWICQFKDIKVFSEMAIMPEMLKVIWLEKKIIYITR